MKFLAMAALAAGMLFGQTGQTQTTPQGPARARAIRPAMRQRMMKALGLTSSQKEQAKAITQQTKASAKPLREQLKQDRQAMAAAIKSNNTTQIQQLAADQGSIMGRLAALRAEGRAKFYATLTPDQRTRADQMQDRLQQRVQKRIAKRA